VWRGENLVGLVVLMGLTANELKIVGRRILAEIDPARFEAAEAKALQREEEHAQRRTFFQSRANGDGTIDIHARVSNAVGMRLRTLLDVGPAEEALG